MYERQVELFKKRDFLYIFLDEGGNFDFSANGTKYFTLTSVTTVRPFIINNSLVELKYDLIENGFYIEYFHAAEDHYKVRSTVFGAIRRNIDRLRIDTLIVEKSKTNPSIRNINVFYPIMLGILLKYPIQILTRLGIDKKLIIVTDRIPVHKKREAVEKAIKKTLSTILPHSFSYKLFHHDSKSSIGLQIVDYCNWAIYRKWDRSDTISYEMIKSSIQCEIDVFKTGVEHYY